MTNWKEYKLENVIKVKHGFAFKGAFFSKEPTNDILLSPGNFNIGGGFKADKFKYYNGTYPKSYILKEGDIIVTMTDLSKEGDTLGYSAKIPPHKGIKYLHNQRLGLLQLIDKDFNIDFIYWLLRTREYQHFIVSSATGTTVKHTSPTRICEYVFKAPNYNTQTAIAEILSSLDDKIELNNKINQELENLAQTLFKQWFIDFEFPNENGEPYKSSGGEMVDSELGEIPKGWEVGTFGDLCKVVNGYAFKSKDFEETGSNGILKIRNVNGSVVDIINTQFVASDVVTSVQEKFRVLTGHILIAMTGAEVGKTGIVPETNKSLWLNQRVGRFEPIIENTIVFIYHMFNVLNFTQSVRNSAMGSAQPNISASGIESINCIIPPKEISLMFSSINQDSFNLTLKNLGENQELAFLRDTILPKLISGDLSINELD